MMKRQAMAALLVLATLLAAPPVLAAQADDTQVDRLLTVMRARQTVEAIVPQVQASQRQIVQQITAGQSLSADQQQRLDQIGYQANSQMLGMLSWHRMQPLYREIYRQTFSSEDMEAMIGFYSSPAGQNLLDKMPQLMQNTNRAMQNVVLPMLEQMQRDLEAEVTRVTVDPSPAEAGPGDSPAVEPAEASQAD